MTEFIGVGLILTILTLYSFWIFLLGSMYERVVQDERQLRKENKQ